jgi:hypothetical protein
LEDGWCRGGKVGEEVGEEEAEPEEEPEEGGGLLAPL